MVLVKVFAGGLTSASPMTIVVDDEDASRNQAREEMHEFVHRGFIPIRVQAQQGNSGRCLRGKRLFNLSLNEMNLVLVVVDVRQCLLDDIQRDAKEIARFS